MGSPLKDYERLPSSFTNMVLPVTTAAQGTLNGIQMFLNNTLTKLKKKPNQRNLKPLDILQKF